MNKRFNADGPARTGIFGPMKHVFTSDLNRMSATKGICGLARCIGVIIYFLCCWGVSEEPSQLRMENRELLEILKYYKSVSKNQIFLAPNIDRAAPASLVVRTPISKAELLELLRESLEQKRCSLKQVETGEMLVDSTATKPGDILRPNNGRNENQSLSLDFPNTDIWDVVEFYRRLTNKPVFGAVDLVGGITLKVRVLRKDAPSTILDKLRESGYQVRELPGGETVIQRSPESPR